MGRETKQQKLILNILKSCRCHPTAKELQELVQKEDISIGQATIYRTLHRCVEKGMVQKILEDGNVYRYDVMPDHYHFKCEVCGKLEDIPLTGQMKETLRIQMEPRSFQSANIMAYGTCQSCKETYEKKV